MLLKSSEVIKYSNRNKEEVTKHAFPNCKFFTHFDISSSSEIIIFKFLRKELTAR